MKTYALFVYGTLRKGGINHHWLADSACLSQSYALQGYRLYNYQNWFPFMVPAEQDAVVLGEVYSISEQTLAQLHLLEDIENQLFRFEYLHDEQLYVYLKYDDHVQNLQPIDHGDWLAFIRKSGF